MYLEHGSHSMRVHGLQRNESAGNAVCRALCNKQQGQLEAMEHEIAQALEIDDTSTGLQHSLREAGALITQARMLLKMAGKR